MSFTIKGQGFEGSGHGMCRVSGSFAVLANGVVNTASVRPSKGNFTITCLATGVYQFAYSQAMVSVVSAGAQIGDSAGAGAGNGTALRTAMGYATASQDFMTTQASNANFAVDTTNKKMVLLAFNSNNNALANIPANTRMSFDFTFAQSSENK